MVIISDYFVCMTYYLSYIHYVRRTIQSSPKQEDIYLKQKETV